MGIRFQDSDGYNGLQLISFVTTSVIFRFEGFVRNTPVFRAVATIKLVGKTWPDAKDFHVKSY